MKKLNLKEKLKNFVDSYKEEEVLIKSTNRKTPLHQKISRLISILLIIAWLIAWLCSIPSSAATDPIGPTQRYVHGKWVFNEDPITSNSNYQQFYPVYFETPLYSYTFIGFRITDSSLEYSTTAGDGHIDAYINNEWYTRDLRVIDFGAIPVAVSDIFYEALTSVAKFAPVGLNDTLWTCNRNYVSIPAGYGVYSVEGFIIDHGGSPFYFDTIYLGYTFVDNASPVSMEHSLSFRGLNDASNDYEYLTVYTDADRLNLQLAIESYTSNSPHLEAFLLTQFQFENQLNSPINPEPTPNYIIESGAYFLEPDNFNFANESFNISIPFYDLDYNNYIGVTLESQMVDGPYRKVVFHGDVTDDVALYYPDSLGTTADVFRGYAHVIWVTEDTAVTQSEYYAFTSAFDFVDAATSFDYDNIALGYRYGLPDGYDDGYVKGFDDALGLDLEGTFLGNFFGGVFDALDNIVMFGETSFLDFAKGALGIFVLLYFLKLIAGG